MAPVRVALGMLLLAGAGAARATDDVDEQARQLYNDGKAAYSAKQFDVAYDRFERAYLTSQKPALLFNMARALEELDRPHDAAEKLRAYVRVMPSDPDREAIELRVRTLEEKQRILDETDRKRHPPAAVVPAALVASSPPPEPRRRRTGLIVGLAVAGVAIVALAVGLGVGLGASRPGEPYTMGTLGAHPGTP